MKTAEDLRRELDGGENIYTFKPKPETDKSKEQGREGEQPKERTNRERLRLVSIPEMDYRGALANLVKGVCGHRQTVLISGDSGSAKTLIAVSLGLHISLGRDWHGRKVKKGFVVYLSPEGGHSVHLRVKAWCRWHGVNEGDPLFRTVPASLDLCNDDTDLDDIIANVKEAEAELGPCLAVFVDTVSRALAGGDENSPLGMGGFVRRLDRLREALGCTVIGVHHTPANGDEPRGHRSLRNAADVRLGTSKIGPGLFALEVRHSKDGEAGAQLLFNLEVEQLGLDEDGDPIEGALVIPADVKPAGMPGTPGKGLTERQKRVVQELQKAARERRSFDFTYDEFGEVVERSGVLTETTNDSTRRGIVRDLRVSLTNRQVIADDGKAKSVRLLTG